MMLPGEVVAKHQLTSIQGRVSMPGMWQFTSIGRTPHFSLLVLGILLTFPFWPLIGIGMNPIRQESSTVKADQFDGCSHNKEWLQDMVPQNAWQVQVNFLFHVRRLKQHVNPTVVRFKMGDRGIILFWWPFWTMKLDYCPCFVKTWKLAIFQAWVIDLFFIISSMVKLMWHLPFFLKKTDVIFRMK